MYIYKLTIIETREEYFTSNLPKAFDVAFEMGLNIPNMTTIQTVYDNFNSKRYSIYSTKEYTIERLFVSTNDLTIDFIMHLEKIDKIKI